LKAEKKLAIDEVDEHKKSPELGPKLRLGMEGISSQHGRWKTEDGRWRWGLERGKR
jgi:hypothetical protein